MVYDWDDKRETCYRMYVVERRHLEDVMKFYKGEGFVPSKRAFQTQFRRWGFPSKQNPAHRNEALVARTRELWETNTAQKDMVVILQAEGFTITERELMRLRSKHRLLLRGANRSKSVFDGRSAAGSEVVETSSRMDLHDSRPESLEPLSENQSMKRKERLVGLQKESDDRWESKKRRRRTRGWAGLPADPPGPPRFPSETTLESSKSCLGLDSTSYMELRAAFQIICQEHHIVKKTISGPERWQAAKDQLIQSYPQLAQTFQQAGQPLSDQLRLSLDVICMDVTKRMRTMERQMTLAEAKNVLRVNPEEGRQLRQALIEILTAHKFVNKHESGNWEQLKQLWMTQSGLDHRIPPPGNCERDKCLRAVQIVCRDIMKRWRDAQVALGSRVVEHAEPVAKKGSLGIGNPEATKQQHSERDFALTNLGEQDGGEPGLHQSVVADSNYDFQIDPNLLKEHPSTLHNPYGQSVGAVSGLSDTLHEGGLPSSAYFR